MSGSSRRIAPGQFGESDEHDVPSRHLRSPHLSLGVAPVGMRRSTWAIASLLLLALSPVGGAEAPTRGLVCKSVATGGPYDSIQVAADGECEFQDCNKSVNVFAHAEKTCTSDSKQVCRGGVNVFLLGSTENCESEHGACNSSVNVADPTSGGNCAAQRLLELLGLA